MIILGKKMLGDALDELMREKKMTNTAMSEILLDAYDYKISRESIGKYRKNERTPEPTLIKYFSDILGVSADYLLGASKKEVARVPVVGTASCGGSEINYLQEKGRKVYYSGERFNKSMYAVIANGDSMASEIENGDEVICDPLQKPVSGDIVHYKLDGESAIKILWIEEDANIIQLIPYNQTESFKTTTIRMDDERFDDLEMTKVVAINKLTFNNRASRLKLIGRT